MRAAPIGIAGVMGGAASEVSDATTAVIVESAIFDPVCIRRTAFRYALRSEASLRFEKGQEHRWRASAPTARRSCCRLGRRRVRARASSTPIPTRRPPAPGRRSGPRASTRCWA